jgi:hypothetical protein
VTCNIFEKMLPGIIPSYYLNSIKKCGAANWGDGFCPSPDGIVGLRKI